MSLDCLLIYPYFIKHDPTQREKRGPFQPLGILYIGKSLKNANYKVKVLDCTFLSSVEEAKEEIKSEMPKIIGITSKITYTRFVKEFISFQKN